MPVKRFSGKQVITSPFGFGRRGKHFHRGVDLRSVRFGKGKGFVHQWGLQSIVFPEWCEVLRFGTDKGGNDFLVAKGLETKYELKFIHVTLQEDVKCKNSWFDSGHVIGKTQIKGQSAAHHLHFEVWKNKKPVNPIEYFKLLEIKYKFK